MRFVPTLLLLVACGASEPATAPAGARSDVTTEAFAEALAAHPLVVDVRTPEEYAGGHVPGAINVPLDTLDPAAEPLASHPAGEPVYLVCHSGSRSARAADLLAEAGLTAVNVEGGTAAWIAAGEPVER